MGSIEDMPMWQKLGAAKRAERDSAFPPEWLLPASFLSQYDLSETSGTNVLSLDIPRKSGILSETELRITEQFTAIELVHELATGTFTSAEVVLAFSKRATIAHQLVRFSYHSFTREWNESN